MRFRWSGQAVDWFIAASKYTGFHNTLASYIYPALSLNDTMYDFGCGLGRLSIELSDNVKHITSVDISAEAIQYLARDIKLRNIANFTPVCANAASLHEKRDIGIMSFFGKSGQDMRFYRNLCNKKLVRIVNARNESTLYPKKYRKTAKDTSEDVKHELKQMGLPFTFTQANIEFGQPLCSYDDAVAYIKFNAPDATSGEIESFLHENLQETKSKEYPFYLPNEKRLGIFIVS